MKAIDQVKSKVSALLGWAPVAAAHLERLAAIEDRLPALARELLALKGPVPHAELVRRTQDWIQRCGQTFRDGTRGATAVDLATVLGPLRRFNDPSAVRVAGRDTGAEDVWYLLCALLGPQLVAAVPAALAGFPDLGGRPVAERPAAIAALETERVELVAEHEDLVEKVRALSGGQVVTAHLPETEERRHKARRIREDAGIYDPPGPSARRG